MTRDITTDVSNETEAKVVQPFLLAELMFDGDPIYAWNGVGTLTWNGNDYTGVGELGGIDPISETSNIQARGIAFSLSGVPSATISLALGSNYSGRIARLRLGFFHTEYTTDQSVTVADDSTSNDNDGTLVNGPTWVTDGPTDRIRGALSFDGVDDFVELDSAIDLQQYAAYTLEFWIRSTESETFKYVFGESNDSGSTTYIGLTTDDGTGHIRYRVVDDSESQVGSITGSATVFDGAWHHIAVVDDNGEAELFVDGVSDGTDSYTRSAITINNTAFGQLLLSGGGSNFYAEADITDPRAWNTARTQQQIQDNMNKRLTGDESGLVGYWPLDDGVIERGEIIQDPFVIAEGFMDQLDIMEEGDTSQVTIKAESRLITLQRARAFLYDHEDQQAIYPGDKGFEFVPALQNKEISWGVGTGRANAPRKVGNVGSPWDGPGNAGGRGAQPAPSPSGNTGAGKGSFTGNDSGGTSGNTGAQKG